MSAADLMFAELRELIEKTWGYRELRPLQEPSMQAFLQGRDSLVVLPTGGGKSLCYQAPAYLLSKKGRGPTVVVSPLIALMKDQVDSLRELGVAASQLDSSLSPDDRREVASDLRSGQLHMLFVSPERLVGAGGESLQAMLRDCGVKNFAIDEAHCISHWGHDFRPEYRQLSRLKEFFPGANVHAFTATATTQVRRDIVGQLHLDDPEVLVGSFDRPNLTYRVLPRKDMYGQIHEVFERHKGEAGIIYAMRRRDVDEISKYLDGDKKLGRKVAGYHAGMTPQLRRKVQEQFIEEKCDLIVATIAFGMGIDRSNIRFIIHTAMPKSVEAYQQETGRAGRDGLEAECVLLYSAADTISWKSLIEKSVNEADSAGVRMDPKYLPSALRHIDDMDRFARGATCRHRSLVEYFGQTYAASTRDSELSPQESGCGACDMCLGDTTPVADSVVIAQKILSCVARTDQRFGVTHLISVLRGENVEKVRKFGHDKLSTYGLLKEFSQGELRDFIYQLIGQGALAQENLVLGSGHTVSIPKLNAAALEVMKGRRGVKLVQIVRKSAKETRRTRGEALSWEGVDNELFESLRNWRRKTAEKRSLPPYVVFSDATLRELARVRPTSESALRRVYGVGERKVADFGSEVTDLISRECQQRGITANVSSSPAPEPRTPGPATSAARREAAERFRRGEPIALVASAMDRATSTVTQYLVEFVNEERPESITPWVPEAIYRKVAPVVIEKSGSTVKEMFTTLEEKVPYEQIRLVVAHMRALQKI